MSTYETYAALMLRRCRLITRDPNLADDAFQEAYMSLIRYGSDFRKIESKLRWLYTLCDRACFETLKKRRNVDRDNYVLDVLDESEDIGIRLEHRQSVTHFWNDLDEQERQIAVLKYVDGLNQHKIAEIVELPRATISKKISAINEKAKALSEAETNA